MTSMPTRYLLEAHSVAESRPVDVAALPPDIAEMYRYWMEKRGGGFAPLLSAFRLDELPATVLPLATLADVRASPLDFVYRFWGSGRTAQQGKDYTGCSIDEVRPESIARKIRKEYEEVYHQRMGMHFVSSCTLDDGRTLGYHFIRLPLRGPGDTVAHIFCTEFNRSPDE